MGAARVPRPRLHFAYMGITHFPKHRDCACLCGPKADKGRLAPMCAGDNPLQARSFRCRDAAGGRVSACGSHAARCICQLLSGAGGRFRVMFNRQRGFVRDFSFFCVVMIG